MKYFIYITFSLFLSFSSCNSQNSEKGKDIKVTFIKKKSDEEIVGQRTAKYTKVKFIPLPKGYKRIKTAPNSFGMFLRNMDLKTENNKVFLYNGELKANQSAQFAVIKIDVGKTDLQQCADAVMRLRAEYLFKQKKYGDIHFNFLSDGKPRYYNEYSKGDNSRKKFRKYMNYIFSYANTASLKNELKKVNSISEIQIGDVFIQKGSPYGHAITVMDVAVNEQNKKIFMLSQSYMPAQDIHILKNPNNKKTSPWYEINNRGKLDTPEWSFTYDDLMRF